MTLSCCLVHRRDPEGIFMEPVTDDIAPAYSSIIKCPMDLLTMASKMESDVYHSLKEFKVRSNQAVNIIYRQGIGVPYSRVLLGTLCL